MTTKLRYKGGEDNDVAEELLFFFWSVIYTPGDSAATYFDYSIFIMYDHNLTYLL